MTEKPTEELPNNPLSSGKNDIKTEDIYFDDNYLDDRKDFEIKVGGDDLIVHKSQC